MVAEAQEPGRKGNDNDICPLCLQRRGLHDGVAIHHAFVEEGQDPGAAVNPPKKKEAPKQGAPTLIVAPAPDLVLRQLLLRKGLVTTEELEAMERELSVGILGIQPPGQAPRVFAEPPANS